jgi:hypothetical protein
MTDLDLDMRMRRLAAEGADLASIPGAERAIRRGRRRRRNLAGAAALLLVAVLAGGAGLRTLLHQPTVAPVANPRLEPGLPPSVLPGEQPRFTIVRSTAKKVRVVGTWRGHRWHYDYSPDRDWLELDNGAGGGGSVDGVKLRVNGTTCCEYPVGKPRPPDPVLEVLTVTDHAAVVRITFQLNGRLLGPVDFRPVPAGPRMPVGFVVLERYPNDGAMVFREIVLLDRDGQRMCQERYDRKGGYDWKASQPDPCSA